MQKLLWLSWFMFLLSVSAVLCGGITLLMTHHVRSLYYAYAGFIGMGISGLLMTIAYGAYL